MLQTVVQHGGREGQYWAPKPNHYTVKWLYLGNHSEKDTCSYKVFLLRMTDTMTSQNIELSSWYILYSTVLINVCLLTSKILKKGISMFSSLVPTSSLFQRVFTVECKNHISKHCVTCTCLCSKCGLK